jgi:hypothetical protein
MQVLRILKDDSVSRLPGDWAGLRSPVERATVRLVMDRTAVLLLGTLVGAAIGWAFHASPGSSATVVAAPPPVAKERPASPQATEAALLLRYGAPFKQAVKTAETGGPVRIGVFGDSFGDGVWWALLSQLPSKAG